MSPQTVQAAQALLDVLALQDDTESPLYALAEENLHKNAPFVVLAAQLIAWQLICTLADQTGCDRSQLIGELRAVVRQFEDSTRDR